MNSNERRRLRQLEELAAKRQEAEIPPGTTRYGRPVPYHNQEVAAIKKGPEEYRRLMHQYGWTDEDLEEESRWWRKVDQRIEEAALDELTQMYNQINFMSVYGPHERYPGPHHWVAGDATLPHPTPEICAQREAEWEARQGGGGAL
jgi:hypothetical protein